MLMDTVNSMHCVYMYIIDIVMALICFNNPEFSGFVTCE